MCTYKTPRKGNLDRHLYSKHKVKINEGKVSVNIGFGIFEETYEKVVPKIEETEKPSNVFMSLLCVFNKYTSQFRKASWKETWKK